VIPLRKVLSVVSGLGPGKREQRGAKKLGDELTSQGDDNDRAGGNELRNKKGENWSLQYDDSNTEGRRSRKFQEKRLMYEEKPINSNSD